MVHPDPEYWPLLKRGWAFQERILSPRVLHFCDTEMIWECKEYTLCECGDCRSMGKEEYHRILDHPSTAKLVKQWEDLVEAYSDLALSYESDKLPALSGLAKQMARLRPKARYLAGLWSDSLQWDLLWKNVKAGSHYQTWGTRPSSWRTPSWSWAAVDTKVVFPLSDSCFTSYEECVGELIKTYSTISDVQTCLATEDPTGQVKGAWLTISGPLFATTLLIDARIEGLGRFVLSIDITGKIIQQYPEPYGQNHARVSFDVHNGPFHLSSEIDWPDGDIYCIRMARVRLKHTYPRDKVEEKEYPLVVYRPSGATEYKRVGIVVQERASELTEHLVNPSGMWEDWPSCFAMGGLQHTITIV